MPALSSADPPPRTIYSLGTSTRPWEKFVAILKSFAIEALVDVRRFPQSRRYPYFSQENLAANSPREGTQYFYLGKELGGFRRPDYMAYMASEPFRSGIDQVEAIGRRHRAAFFCSEALPWRCHRRFIARELMQRGWQVIHILDEKRVWEPEEPK